MLVKDIMKSFLNIDCKKTVSEAAEAMEKAHTGSALIECNGKPVGIVTERDFLKKVIMKRLDPSKTTIGDIMSKPLITINQNDDVYKASELMDKKNIRRLAVVDGNGKIVGKITTSRISKNLKFIRAQQITTVRRSESTLFT